MIRLCIALLCVGGSVFVCKRYKLICLDSTPSTLQVCVFREGEMATGLDYDCRGATEGRMDKELQVNCGTWPYGTYGTQRTLLPQLYNCQLMTS
jgi:hypothetical protein